MTGSPDTGERGHATAKPRGRPTLEPHERLWLENYLERLRKAPGGLLKRLVVYGSKARGDAGRTSDVDVLVLVGEVPDAVRNARHLIYRVDDPNGVDYNVVVRAEADWLQGVHNELPFARNVKAEGVQLHPVHRPARSRPGDRPPVTRRGIRNALPIWLAAAQSDLKALRSEIDLLKDGRLKVPGIAARAAFDAVFFSTMAWCLIRGVSVVRREDLPTSVERHLIEPGVLNPGWRDRIRTLWAAWKVEVDWNPSRDTQPTIEDAAQWAETARDFCGLARDAIVADGIETRRTKSERAGTPPSLRRRRERGAFGTPGPSTPNMGSGAASS